MEEKIVQLHRNATALHETMKFTYGGDHNDLSRYGSFEVFARKYNVIAKSASKYVDLSILDFYLEDELPSPSSLTWPQQKSLFDGVLANLGLLISLLENHLGIKQNKIQELKDFLGNNLRKGVIGTPTKEKDIQNAIETLFIGKGLSKGIDFDREKGRVKVSIKEVVPDFIFMKLGLALEVKFTKDYQKSKAIVDEINADIRSYSKEYSELLFVIYDCGTIRDEQEFKNDIEDKDKVHVVIVKH